MAPVTKNQVGGIFTLLFVAKYLHYEVISQRRNTMQFNKCDLFFILLQLSYILAHMPWFPLQSTLNPTHSVFPVALLLWKKTIWLSLLCSLPQNPLMHRINWTHETFPLQGRFYLVKHYCFSLAHVDPAKEKSNLKRDTFSRNNQVLFNIISFLFVERGWFAHALWFFAPPPLEK